MKLDPRIFKYWWGAFSENPLRCRKERLNTGKLAEFESDLLKKNEEIAPQSREILQTANWQGITT